MRSEAKNRTKTQKERPRMDAKGREKFVSIRVHSWLILLVAVIQATSHLAHHLRELQHLQPRRTLRPVMPPADDQVALLRAVSVFEEVTAQELEFNGHALAASGLDFAQGLAIRESALRAQHGEPQALRQNAKEQDHAVFVRGLVRQPRDSEYGSVEGPSTVKL